jgi:hypothetical protein
VKKPATRRKRNPPSRVIESPLRDWILNGDRFSTVTVPLDNGKHLSVVLSDPEIRATAPSKHDAESAVIRLFEQQSREPNPLPVDDDERDHQLIQKGLRRKGRPLEDVLRDLKL